MLFLSINNILAEDYDTTPLTLQNFNFEFNYNFQDLNLNLTNFNFEFDYIILQTFKFDLTEYISDYSRYKKLWELYPQLSGVSGFKFWHELATLENDNYYREPNLPYLKFKRLAAKYK